MEKMEFSKYCHESNVIVCKVHASMPSIGYSSIIIQIPWIQTHLLALITYK